MSSSVYLLELLDMSIRRRVDFVLNCADRPRPVPSFGIGHCDVELIFIGERAGEGFAGRGGDRDLGLRVLWIEHLHFEFQALATRWQSLPDRR